MGLESFVKRPLAVAAALDEGACGGSYAEACILVAGVISSVASFIWPGERIDRKRFVEAWARFADGDAARISLPLLVRTLREAGRLDEAAALERVRPLMFGAGYGVRVLTGDEVDAPETELVASCPTIDLPTLRRHSYPVLFYEHVRSKLVHEYELGDRASAWPMTTRKVGVSYTNQLRQAELEGDVHVHGDHGVDRRIHFHMPWLVDLATQIACNADKALAAGPVVVPDPWWLPDVRRAAEPERGR